jgi:hypothetical protein
MWELQFAGTGLLCDDVLTPMSIVADANARRSTQLHYVVIYCFVDVFVAGDFEQCDLRRHSHLVRTPEAFVEQPLGEPSLNASSRSG